MTDLSRPVLPAVALNDNILEYHPLTTEESFKDNPELVRVIENINQVNPEDHKVPAAIIVDKDNPNKLVIPSGEVDLSSGEEELQEIIIDDILQPTESISTTPISMSLVHHAPATTATTTATATGSIDAPSRKPNIEEEDDDSDADDELLRITESNRHIPVIKTKDSAELPRSKSLRSQSVSTRRHLLVFADKPIVSKKSDRIVVTNHYGAGPEGKLDLHLKPSRRCRSYLVACDFSDESFHAIEWTMGTMMRDGDKLYVITAVNREDNPEAVKEAGLSLSKELKKASDTITEESKKILGQMLLFDVDLITFAISGRVKDVLINLIEEIPLTMVVCGSRGRGTVKGLLMGSISTYLVHKSPVPVTVIRPQKKKKAAHKRPVHTMPLSQSVQSGHLAVDEISKTTRTTSSDTSSTNK